MKDNDDTCCLLFKLKLGVAFIATITWVSGLICLLALFVGDVRFQGNGYNLNFYRLPSIVGSFGLIFGFVGLLGVYDSSVRLMRNFNWFLCVKISAMLVTMLADLYSLFQCDNYMSSQLHTTQKSHSHLGLSMEGNNPQIERLAEAGVCPKARLAYVLGCAIDLGVWLYFAWSSYSFQRDLESGARHPIDFSMERHDQQSRWSFFRVKDPDSYAPPRTAKQLPTVNEEAQYGSMMPPAHSVLEGGPGAFDMEGGAGAGLLGSGMGGAPPIA
mmetsp:Transcript_11534/g.24221  ORF Transcript_11534/g.24221 Transcript_11534/m.24221 type:complete len:271 (+) Transcript_11534:140-952(+)